MNQPGAHGAGEGWTPAVPTLFGFDYDGVVDRHSDSFVEIPASLPVTLLAVVAVTSGAYGVIVALFNAALTGYLTLQHGGVGAVGRILLYGGISGIKQQIQLTAPNALTPGVPYLLHGHVASGADSKIYVNGVEASAVTTGVAWAGTPVSRVSIGQRYDGLYPGNSTVYRAAFHTGTVDPALVYALRNKSWDALALDHLWEMGDSHGDSALVVRDVGAVGGWDLSPAGAPTLTYGQVILP